MKSMCPAFPYRMLPKDDPRNTMQENYPKPIELLVCRSCRHGITNSEDDIRPGTRLLKALQRTSLPTEMTIKSVSCLANCSNGCSIVLRSSERWSYVYGNLNPAEHVDIIIDGAKKYLDAADGKVPWRKRSDHFRKNCVARIPPIEVEND